jgi:hypothetical protein
MEKKIYHGKIKPRDFAQALIAEFNHSNLRAQQVGRGNKIAVQIATRQYRRSGGQTALTVHLEKVKDGVAVSVGKQSWLGVVGSLGTTLLLGLASPFRLLGRIDDVAQDIESLNISDRVWEVVEAVAKSAGATFELSERLRRLVCDFCETANPIDAAHCIACGAPMGDAQPRTCPHCGYVVTREESICPNCKARL